MFPRFTAVALAPLVIAALPLLLGAAAAADPVRDDIYRLAGDVRNEAYSSSADAAASQRARADLDSALSNLRGGNGGGGGGGGGSGSDGSIFCKMINTSSFYAPARVADGAWLEDNGTDLARCQAQVGGARAGLLCAHVGTTDFYAPNIIVSKVWRGDNGTDFGTCDQQVRGARPTIFCQHIRDTTYYAPARIDTGAWLQDNGTSLGDCLASLGGFDLDREALPRGSSVEPLTDGRGSSATAPN